MTATPLELSRTGRDVATWTLHDVPDGATVEVFLEGSWRAVTPVDGKVSVSVLGPTYTGPANGVRLTRSQLGRVRADGIERSDQRIHIL
jgi:hypothetical protein